MLSRPEVVTAQSDVLKKAQKETANSSSSEKWKAEIRITKSEEYGSLSLELSRGSAVVTATFYGLDGRQVGV
jgi:hypothetical protein